MLALLLLTAPFAQVTCDVCSLVNEDVRLCKAHVEAEHSTFVRVRKQLSSRDESQRIAGLEALANLTWNHANAPSERVARRIASALDDRSDGVRERAAELLGRPQHATIAMKALLRALPGVEKEYEKLDRERDQLQEKRARSAVRSTQEKILDRKLAENDDEVEALLGYRSAIIEQLGGFPDDRVVAALGEQSFGLDTTVALGRLGNRQALRTALAGLRDRQRLIDELEGYCNNLERSSGPPQVQFRRYYETLLVDTQADLERLRADGESVQNWLIIVLSEKQYAPPAPTRWAPDVLGAWLEQNLDSFPEHLPGVTSPVW
jgi:hypothetical protein